MTRKEIKVLYNSVRSEVSYEEMYDWYIHSFQPKLCDYVRKQNANIWYEVWIDITDFMLGKWYLYMRCYPDLAKHSIYRWMIKRDKWYWSPQYVKELDAALKEVGDI